ncbi:hypothetical protein ABT186_05705 [Streptomyces sp. NPDC001634]|uniref:hypothetical protein n=1 Tax=Streptomyces sp. NPDC001634 TaxID=3154390 RepID=UPI00332702D8
MNSKRIRLALAACAVAAGLATALDLWLTRDTDTQEAAVLGEVLVSADGQTITTAVRWTPCQEVKPRLVAHESSNSVSLVLHEGTADLRHQCASTPQQISTILRSPLGSRKLTEAGTAWTITPFHATQLISPHYLPPGYRQTDNIYPEDAGQRPIPSPFERTATQDPVWTRFYSTTSGQPSLSITQISGTNPRGAAPGKQVSGKDVSISGHSGHLDDKTPDNRTLAWSDGTYTFVINTASPHITDAQLLEIASHLN